MAATTANPTLPRSDRIAASLDPPQIQLGLGEEASVRITVQNNAAVVDEFFLQAEGLDPKWFTLATRGSSLFPGESQELELQLHLPVDRSVEAGVRRIGLRVTSRQDPTQVTGLELLLEVMPFGRVEMEISPKVVTTTRTGRFRVKLTNQGNAEQLVDLVVTDEEQALKTNLELDRVAVAPGDYDEVRLKVRPKRLHLISPPVRYSFEVLAYPAGDELAEAKTTAEGTLEVRAPLTFLSGVLPLLQRFLQPMIILAAIAAVAVWFAGAPGERAPGADPRPTFPPIIIPAPPDEEDPAAGAASGAAGANGAASAGAGAAGGAGAGNAGGAAAGQASVGAGAGAAGGAGGDGAAGTGAAAGAGTGAEGAAAGTAPLINQFEVQVPPNATPGEVALVWNVAAASTVTVAGTPQPPVATQTVRLNEVDGTQIELTAANEAGTVSQSIGVVVFRAPVVMAFEIAPDTVQAGQPVTLRWQANRAASAAIYGPGLDPNGRPVDRAEGTLEVTPDASGPYRLVVKNDIGQATQQVEVRVQQATSGAPARGSLPTPTVLSAPPPVGTPPPGH